MRTITSVEHVEFFTARDGRRHARTHALLDDGTEAVGFGKDFKVNDKVEVFFHYEQVKMRLSNKRIIEESNP